MLDTDTIKVLIPPAGPRLKFTKLLAEYKSSIEEVLLEATIPTTSSSINDIDLTSVSESESSLASSDYSCPSARISFDSVNLDLKQILEKKYPNILSLLIENKQIGWCDKQRINRIFVSALTEKYGPFPSTARKANLAQLIIQEFPSLKGHEGKGYEQWFCQGQNGSASSGLIEERIKNWRKRLSPGDKTAFGIRKRKASEDKEARKNTAISQEVIQMQQWLKENSTPRSVVIERMRDTAAARDVFIFDEKHTLTEILDAWPRLLDAEIIDTEFVRRYSQQQGDAFCSEFGLLSEKIIFQAKNCGRTAAEKFALELSAAQDSDRNISALRLLPFLLPQTSFLIKEQGKKETTRIKPTSQVSKLHFIDVIPEATNLDYYLTNDRLGPDKRRKQPFVLLTGDESRPSQIFVIVENHAINAPTVLKGVDLCFKIHFICDIDYSEFCKNVWYFLDIVFYKTATLSDKHIPASVRELKAQLFSQVSE